jgi:DNA-binding CsgD family transcriptional regulator/tetratricopeptide (TPR) repeat protein
MSKVSQSASRAIQPTAGVLERAERAWFEGRNEETLALLEHAVFARSADRLHATLLRARALLALKNPSGIVEMIGAVRKDARTVDERAVADMLTAATLLQLGERERGRVLLDEIVERRESLHASIGAEIAYYRGRTRWAAREYDEAERIIEAALPQASDIIRARLYCMLGFVEFNREAHASATRQFSAALEVLRTSSHADAQTKTASLLALAAIAGETIDLNLMRFVEQVYPQIEWSTESSREHVQLHHMLAFFSLLRGDIDGAWQHRTQMLKLAQDTACEVLAQVGLAEIAGIDGDARTQERHLRAAGMAAQTLRGKNLSVDEQIALLTFVDGVPPPLTMMAVDVMSIYEQHREQNNGEYFWTLAGDRRVQGVELSARGNLAKCTGDERRAIGLYSEALQLWRKIAYRMRAAMSARDLYLLTHDIRYAREAEAFLSQVPDATLHRDLDESTATFAALSPTELIVLKAMCRGLTTNEIAEELNRSPNTITNHTRRIFEVLGVRNRAGAVARAVSARAVVG